MAGANITGIRKDEQLRKLASVNIQITEMQKYAKFLNTLTARFQVLYIVLHHIRNQ